MDIRLEIPGYDEDNISSRVGVIELTYDTSNYNCGMVTLKYIQGRDESSTCSVVVKQDDLKEMLRLLP